MNAYRRPTRGSGSKGLERWTALSHALRLDSRADLVSQQPCLALTLARTTLCDDSEKKKKKTTAQKEKNRHMSCHFYPDSDSVFVNVFFFFFR